MKKLDLTKEYKQYYTAKNKPELVSIEAAQYLSINGKNDPSSKEFTENIQALYTIAYTIKFMCKALDKDFTVAKLEGLWWYDEQLYKYVTPEASPALVPRSEWQYKLLIRLPEFVNTAHIATAIATAVEKKKTILSKNVSLHLIPAHKAVQMLHIGSFEKEPETISQIIDFMNSNNFAKGGHHHEIYLSDFRKTAVEKLKTILREPIA